MEVELYHVPIAHEDERRKLIAVINGGFTVKQIKLLNIKKEGVLGSHYHSYFELFYVVLGEAIYTLESVDTKERKTVTLNPGDRLVIGPKVAHMAVMTEGTVMIEATEQVYESAEVNDVRYEIK